MLRTAAGRPYVRLASHHVSAPRIAFSRPRTGAITDTIPRLSTRHASGGAPRSSKGDGPSTNLIVAIAVVGAAAYYLWPAEAPWASKSPTKPEPFSITIRGQQHVFETLSKTEVEAMLRRNEWKSQVDNRPGNPVLRWEGNCVGSNEPCEDRNAADILTETGGETQTHGGVRGSGDLAFFSVFDGHSGWAVSDKLSKELHTTLADDLTRLKAGELPDVDQQRGANGWFTRYMPGVVLNAFGWQDASAPLDVQRVSRALSNAFQRVDSEIVNAPADLLRNIGTAPDRAAAEKELLERLELAQNGACVLSAVVDAEHGDLYVASTGDCRAVAGWEKDGVWRCDVLTEDQMGDNAREVKRMQNEHPKGEQDTVIIKGRIHGGLQPTRAFGDARYKWSTADAKMIFSYLDEQGLKARRPSIYSFTPPYATARPEIAHRKIDPQTGEKLRFIILATDGLWDSITSEEATLLVASHMRRPIGVDIPKTALPKEYPLAAAQGERPFPVQPLPGTEDRAEGAWVYAADTNAATHLIRNSLGADNRVLRTQLLSLTGKMSRRYRDDATVNVIFFNDPDEAVVPQ